MSRRAEILHKLSTDDRIYLSEKFKEKDTRILDLEVKLAQSKMNESFEKEKKDNAFKLIEELKQQLAEEEKEIERIKNNYVGGMQNANLATSTFKDLYYKEHQDKISFCIEKLEKVKNTVESKVESICKRLDDLNIKIVCESTSRELSACEEIVEQIDNQIKQLKEGNRDE